MAARPEVISYPAMRTDSKHPHKPQKMYAATPWGMYRLVRSEAGTAVEEEQVVPSILSLRQNSQKRTAWRMLE